MGQGLDHFVWLIIAINMSVLPAALHACSHFIDLTNQLESCNQNFTAYKTMVLNGQLTSKNRPAVCKRYDDVTECIDNVIADCQLEDAIHLEHARSVLRDHVQGFGSLCADDDTFFSKYAMAAPCYSRLSPQTTPCIDTFTNTILEWHHAETQDEYNYEDDYGNPSICKSIQNMYTCVASAVKSCGEEARSMYTKLCQLHVPQELMSHCKDTEPYWNIETDASPGMHATRAPFCSMTTVLIWIYMQYLY